MSEFSIVDVVFQDLSDAFAEVTSGSTSPKTVRRSFGNFVNLSQKLSATMYKEYSAKTGQSWSASDFNGWNEVTELFKQIRNDDEHEHPVSILVHETQYFKIFEGAPEVALTGTWSFSLEDQLLGNPRDDLRLELADPETGQPSGESVAPVRKEYEFHLSPTSKKAKNLLTKIGDPNVQTLSKSCFSVLTNYYQYYRSQLPQS
jgi:hypothetical protein